MSFDYWQKEFNRWRHQCWCCGSPIAERGELCPSCYAQYLRGVDLPCVNSYSKQKYIKKHSLRTSKVTTHGAVKPD